MNARYEKQVMFVGAKTQQRLAEAKVLIVGAGALGSSSADMLVRAGVGELTIVDRDYVEWSNLQRQQLYTESDVQQQLPKAVAAQNRLRQINSTVTIRGVVADVHAANMAALLEGHTLVVDATDNLETSLIVNDAAVKQSVPYIFGACVGSYGLVLPIVPGETPCLHCLLEQLPLEQMTCDTVGVISPIVQIVAAMQVTSALKYFAGQALPPRLWSMDIWQEARAAIDVAKLMRADCPTCGAQPTYPYLQGTEQLKAYVLCGRDAVQVRPNEQQVYALDVVAQRIAPHAELLARNPYLLSCQFANHRFVFFADGRAIVHGVTDTEQARVIYTKFQQFAHIK